jgi:hypothetical protein
MPQYKKSSSHSNPLPVLRCNMRHKGWLPDQLGVTQQAWHAA